MADLRLISAGPLPDHPFTNPPHVTMHGLALNSCNPVPLDPSHSQGGLGNLSYWDSQAPLTRHVANASTLLGLA